MNQMDAGMEVSLQEELDVSHVVGANDRLLSEGRRIFGQLCGERVGKKTSLARLGDFVSIWGEDTGRGSQHWIGKICYFWQSRASDELFCCVRWMCQPEFTVVRTAAHPAEIFATEQYCHDVSIRVRKKRKKERKKRKRKRKKEKEREKENEKERRKRKKKKKKKKKKKETRKKKKEKNLLIPIVLSRLWNGILK